MREFQYTFVVARGRIFEVNYRTLATNAKPYFATSAAKFNRPRTDFNQCGQAQDDLLVGVARKFYKKWDRLHLKELTEDQHAELSQDIEALKIAYPYYIETEGEDIRFSQEVELERRWRERAGRQFTEIK